MLLRKHYLLIDCIYKIYIHIQIINTHDNNHDNVKTTNFNADAWMEKWTNVPVIMYDDEKIDFQSIIIQKHSYLQNFKDKELNDMIKIRHIKLQKNKKKKEFKIQAMIDWSNRIKNEVLFFFIYKSFT